MASGNWEGSTRRVSLGKEYFRARAIVMRRDGRQCRIRTPGLCIGTATECDHVGDRLDHSPENMRAACTPCHRDRSSQQGGQAAGVARKARAAARFRKAEDHPGLLPPATNGDR